MVYNRRVGDALRAYVLLWVKDNNDKAKDVAKEVGMPLAGVCRTKKEGVRGLKREEGKKRLKLSAGRPRKLNTREERMLLRQIKVLLEEYSELLLRKAYGILWYFFPASQQLHYPQTATQKRFWLQGVQEKRCANETRHQEKIYVCSRSQKRKKASGRFVDK